MGVNFNDSRWARNTAGQLVCSDECPHYALAVTTIHGAFGVEDSIPSRLCRVNGHFKQSPYTVDPACMRSKELADMVKRMEVATIRYLLDHEHPDMARNNTERKMLAVLCVEGLWKRGACPTQTELNIAGLLDLNDPLADTEPVETPPAVDAGPGLFDGGGK